MHKNTLQQKHWICIIQYCKVIYLLVDLHCNCFWSAFLHFFLHEKICSCLCTYLYVYIHIDQTVTYWTKVFQKNFWKGYSLTFEISEKGGRNLAPQQHPKNISKRPSNRVGKFEPPSKSGAIFPKYCLRLEFPWSVGWRACSMCFIVCCWKARF